MHHLIHWLFGGETSLEDLCCLCRRHHRIETHARDWDFRMSPDGTLTVRTPAGVTRHTEPPGWYPHPEPDPPWLEELAPADVMRT